MPIIHSYSSAHGIDAPSLNELCTIHPNGLLTLCTQSANNWYQILLPPKLQTSMLMLQKLAVPEDTAEANFQLWSDVINNQEEWCDNRNTGTSRVCRPVSTGSDIAPDFVHRVLVLEPRRPALRISDPSTLPWAVEKLPMLRLLEAANQYCSKVSNYTSAGNASCNNRRHWFGV